MRHLVTGGAGFLGSALVRRLLAEGHEVNVLDRFTRGKADRLPPEARAYRGDIRNPTQVASAATACDAIWHLAYVQGTQTFYANPREVIDVALRGIVNALDAAAGKDFFLVSSSEVYQEPPSFPTDETVPLSVPDVTNPRYSYGGGKIACELATLAHAEDWLNRAVIVRPHNIIGPDMGHDHVVPQLAERVQALEGRALEIQGDGRATRCFCFIDDAIDGLMVAYDSAPDGVYHLGDPREEISVGALALKIAAHYGRDVTLAPTELPKGSPTRRRPDIAKLGALGYNPKVGLDDALARTLEWYRA